VFVVCFSDELFTANPLNKYVQQIAEVVLQVRAQLHFYKVKLDMIKTELDAMRLGLETFLEKVNDASEETQSLLDYSINVPDDGTRQVAISLDN